MTRAVDHSFAAFATFVVLLATCIPVIFAPATPLYAAPVVA